MIQLTAKCQAHTKETTGANKTTTKPDANGHWLSRICLDTKQFVGQ